MKYKIDLITLTYALISVFPDNTLRELKHVLDSVKLWEKELKEEQGTYVPTVTNERLAFFIGLRLNLRAERIQMLSKELDKLQA